MRRVLVLAIALAVMMALAAPAGAAGKGKGAVQMSGLGEDLGECADVTAEVGAFNPDENFDITMTPDPDAEWTLDGCLRQFFGPGQESASGVYKERGIEVFVGELVYQGAGGEMRWEGTFETTYLFTAKADQFGRCQHPITAGSGTEELAGITGRMNFVDDLDADPVNFPWTGHAKLPGATAS